MKKFVVICYAVHDEKIVGHKTFATMKDAVAFMQTDAQITYMEYSDEAPSTKLTIDGNSARLSSCDGDFVWTWEIITV